MDQNGRVAGIAVVRQKFLLGDYLELLGVADWARGKGLGGRLLAHVEAVVFERTKNLFACVSDFNDQARHFYKKQGYQEIGPMPNFLIQGSAEILLRKTSGPARGTRRRNRCELRSSSTPACASAIWTKQYSFIRMS